MKKTGIFESVFESVFESTFGEYDEIVSYGTDTIEVSGYTLVPSTYNNIPYYEVYYNVRGTEVVGTLIKESVYKASVDMGEMPTKYNPLDPINFIGTEELELWDTEDLMPLDSFFVKDNLKDIWEAIENANNKTLK